MDAIAQGWCRESPAPASLIQFVSGDVQTADLGQRVFLPASFTGGPRQMRKAYLDAIALTRRFGPPDFFITFTCNTSWIEIQRALPPGQTTHDRPDTVNRVFNMKLSQLQVELVKKGVLGKAAALVWTIEFQKRGLPHAHMLLILDPASRMQTADEIDAAICAEISDPVQDLLTYDVVTRFMLHNPCGPGFSHASCMRDGRCRWRFPKPFQDETVLNNGRPIYKRQDNGRIHRKGNPPVEYDNRSVAPYNRYISQRYNAHINVEC